jgi:hypothetical protein
MGLDGIRGRWNSYEVSMRMIATPLVLGLQGVDMDRTYLLASSEDSEGGASRSICQRAPGVTNYRNIRLCAAATTDSYANDC